MLIKVLLALASIVAVGVAWDPHYRILVETGDQFQADTDANLYIILNGTSGRTDLIHLDNTDINDFERDSRDSFDVKAKDIGEVLSVEVELDDHGHSPDWYLIKFIVVVKETSKVYAFNCDCWVYPGEERTLSVADTFWYLELTTNNIPSAGTDGPVSMILHGDKGHSRTIVLNNPEDDFERGETSGFRVATVDIGTPTNISITAGRDGKSNSWHLDHVELEDVNGLQRYSGKCDCWFDMDNSNGTDTKFISLELVVYG